MKTLTIALVTCLSLLMLSSCYRQSDCDYCWRGTFKRSDCGGTCIKYKCEHVCNNCAFHGPDCKACWNCVGYDECSDTYKTDL